MGEQFQIFCEILVSFLAVVGFVYLCIEVWGAVFYKKKRYNIPIIIDTVNYSYEEILFIVKAFATIMNIKAANAIFGRITILSSSATDAIKISEMLGRYDYFVNTQIKEESE